MQQQQQKSKTEDNALFKAEAVYLPKCPYEPAEWSLGLCVHVCLCVLVLHRMDIV